jgi:hypothetical protein
MSRETTMSNEILKLDSDANPYKVFPESSPFSEAQSAAARSGMVPRERLISIAIVWMVGTTLSGGAFGTLIFPIIGTAVGFVLAAMTSLPISLIVFTVARLIPGPARKRSTVLSLGALSGGLSGFFAVMFIFSFQSDLLGYALLAMCLGAAGSLLATMLFLRSASEIVRTRYTPPAVWADLDTVQAPSGEFKF